MNLKKIEELLNLSVSLNGGVKNSIEICEKMYSQSFRSEPYTLSSFIEMNPDFEELELMIENLKNSIIIHAYNLSGIEKPPVKPSSKFFNNHDEESDDDYDEDSCFQDEYEDYEMDSYYSYLESYEYNAISWFNSNGLKAEITNDLLLVDLCNYKGEGEDTAVVYELNKHLPVFKSKSESFFSCR